MSLQESINQCKIIEIHDGEYSAKSLKLQYYCKKMSYIDLVNIYTQLKIVNDAKKITYWVIHHPNGILTNIKVISITNKDSQIWEN